MRSSPLDEFAVKRTRHFVEQNNFRIHREGHGDSDALLLAAGETSEAMIHR
jgi:hypothetical protein